VVGHTALVGSARLLAGAGIDPSGLESVAAELSADGKTPVLAAIDGEPAGVLAIADPVKDDSAAAIAALHHLGAEVVMLTGDNAATAVAIARQVGVRRVLAEVLPEHKAAEIQRLQADGRKVGMVGDGINDAPALAAADVGMAIGTGTDVAIEAADITLISGSLAGVVTAISLSRATMRNIRQNLFFALAYNGIGIPIAAGVLYPAFGIRLSPIIAAAAMAASSLSVVGNANRLRRYHPAPLPAAEVADLEPQVQARSAHCHDVAERDRGQHGQASAAHGGTGHTDDGPAPGATVTDPVCGMLVNPETAAAHRGTGGSAVYFCSAGCATAFDAEPERYAATTGTADR
jgi:Cu+-exporting ATPase